jgi:hypothetical protein
VSILHTRAPVSTPSLAPATFGAFYLRKSSGNLAMLAAIRRDYRAWTRSRRRLTQSSRQQKSQVAGLASWGSPSPYTTVNHYTSARASRCAGGCGATLKLLSSKIRSVQLDRHRCVASYIAGTATQAAYSPAEQRASLAGRYSAQRRMPARLKARYHGRMAAVC